MKITTKQEFENIRPESAKYEHLYNTECKVNQLMRIARALVMWKEGTLYHTDALDQLKAIEEAQYGK